MSHSARLPLIADALEGLDARLTLLAAMGDESKATPLSLQDLENLRTKLMNAPDRARAWVAMQTAWDNALDRIYWVSDQDQERAMMAPLLLVAKAVGGEGVRQGFGTLCGEDAEVGAELEVMMEAMLQAEFDMLHANEHESYEYSTAQSYHL